MIFSLEYAHYDGREPLDLTIKHINSHLTKFLALYPDAQKGIMFDDIHAKLSFSDYHIQLKNLDIQPDIIYAESAFEKYMHLMIQNLVAKGFVLNEDEGRSYIVKVDKKYDQDNRFLLRYESKGEYKFSCPGLVAASYLYRLGYFSEGEKITPLYGDEIKISREGNILSLLPAYYIQVEANARIICEILEPGISERIQYIFY